jgi:4a-hydroxytetrahydrobiopterin dehydratase
MTEALASKTCAPCRGGIPHSRASKLSSFTHRPPDWQLAEEVHCIERSFRFLNLSAALTFLPNIHELTRV